MPKNLRRRNEFQRRSPHFLYYKDTLYIRSLDGVLLRCLGADESFHAMQEEHSGVWGAYQLGPKHHFHTKRMGYYWQTMVKDCLDYAWRYQACLFHANFIHQPPKVLHPTITSWTFEACGLDIVGPLPKYSGGHLYILAAADYFSKWAEVVSVTEVKKRMSQTSFESMLSIVLTFLDIYWQTMQSHLIRSWWQGYVSSSSMYYAAATGLVEAFNETLCILLKKSWVQI